MLNIPSPRNAIGRESHGSMCPRRTRVSPRGYVTGERPPLPSHKPGCCSSGKPLHQGEHNPTLDASSNCRVFNILPISSAPTESHNLHLPRRLPRAQFCRKSCKINIEKGDL